MGWGWDEEAWARTETGERERESQLGKKGVRTISHASKFDGRFVHARREEREAEGVSTKSDMK